MPGNQGQILALRCIHVKLIKETSYREPLLVYQDNIAQHFHLLDLHHLEGTVKLPA